jgi:hypothetical protein
MSEKEILEKLLEFAPFLSIQSMIKDIGRALLYWLTSVLMWIVEKVGDVLSEMVTVLGFYKSGDMTGSGGILDTFSAFQKFGIGITLLIIGAVLFLGKTEETRAVPLNALLMVIIVMLLPSIMSDGLKIVTATANTVNNEQAEFGFDSFKKNVTDVYVLADNGWTTTNPKNKNYLEDRDFFNINEKITDAEDIDNGEPLLYEVVNSKSGSGKELQKFDSDGGGIKEWLMKKLFVTGYYRWSVNWLPLLTTLACLSFSLVISLVRCGRLGIEQGFNYIWANVVAFFSIRNIKYLKTAVMELISGFVLIISIFAMYAVFIAYNAWLGTQQLSVLAQIFGIIGGAWFIYDGPSIIQKTLGIDAGLSTAGSFVMGIGAMKAVKAAGTLTGKSVNGAANTAGFFKGLSEGITTKEEPKNDEKAGLNSEMTKNNKGDLPDGEENKDSKDNLQSEMHNQENSQELDQAQENDLSKDDPELDQETDETSTVVGLGNPEKQEDPNTPENQDIQENQEVPDTSERNEEQEPLSEDPLSYTANDMNLDQTEPYPLEDDLSGSSDFDNYGGEMNNTGTLEGQSASIDEPDNDINQPIQSSLDSVQAGDDLPNSGVTSDSDGQMIHREEENRSSDFEEPTYSPSQSKSASKNSSGNHSESKHSEKEKVEELPNPFSKKVNQMIHTPNYQKNTKNKVGNMVDGYNRNKEFGQDVNEWLKQRRNKKEGEHPESIAPYQERKRAKNKNESE